MRRFLIGGGLAFLLILTLVLSVSLPDERSSPPPPDEASDTLPAALPPEPPPPEPPPPPPVEPEAPPPPAPESGRRTGTVIVSASHGRVPDAIEVTIGESRTNRLLDPEDGAGRRKLEIPDASAGMSIALRTPGFAPAEVVLEAPELRAEVELKALAQLTVRITGAGAQALEVRVTRDGREWMKVVPLPGAAAFEGLEAGEYVVEVVATPRLRLFRATARIEWGEERRLDIGAGELGVRVSGRTEDDSGAPLPEVRVIVRSEGLSAGFELAETEVRSDGSGRFEVILAPELRYQLYAEKEGYGGPVPEAIEVRAADPPHVTLVLSSGTRLVGRVVDPDGKGVPGAAVTLLQMLEREGSGLVERRDAVTDVEGRFSFDDLPEGWKVQRTVEKEGFGVASLSPLRISTGMRPMAVTLHPESPLEVSAVDDATGKPLPGVRLDAGYYGSSDEGGRGFNLFTGKSVRRPKWWKSVVGAEALGPGRWRIRGLSSDRQRYVSATAKGRFRVLEILEPGEAGPVVLSLRRTGDLDISVRVLDPRGRPAGGTFVRASPLERPRREESHVCGGYTGKDGRVRLEGLRSGWSYRFSATRSRGMAAAVVARGHAVLIPEAGREVVLRLLATGRLAGRFTSGIPSVPVVHPAVRFDRHLLPTGEVVDPPPGISRGPLAGSALSLSGVIPGIYTITIVSAKHLPLVIEGVRVEAGKTTRLGTRTLEVGGILELTILDADGRPLGGVYVVAVHEAGWVRVSGKTDEAGRARIEKLRPGRHRIATAGFVGAPSLVAEVEIGEGGTLSLTGEVPSPGRLEVRITDARGRPAAGVAVEVRAEAPPPWDRYLASGPRRDGGLWRGGPTPPERTWEDVGLLTGEDGCVGVGPLSPGRYTVRVEGERRDVTVPSGGTASVELDLGSR